MNEPIDPVVVVESANDAHNVVENDVDDDTRVAIGANSATVNVERCEGEERCGERERVRRGIASKEVQKDLRLKESGSWKMK